MKTLRNKAAIVGVAEADLGRVPDKTTLQLLGQAVSRALDDAGIEKAEVDAVFSAGIPGYGARVSRYLGIDAKYVDATLLGGTSWEAHVEHAVAAIAAGICEVALLTHGSTLFSERNRPDGYRLPDPADPQFEYPYGVEGPIAITALVAQRHMWEYGLTGQQLAEVAVAARRWAMLNPKATRREPLTIEDVLNSQMMCSPLHILDICLMSDAGGAVVIASAERAKRMKKPPLWIIGCGEATGKNEFIAAKPAAARAFRMAGLTVKDIDVAQLYDAFTITVIGLLEAIGFCREGEGGRFVEGGRIAPGGELPVNTSGGGLSYMHPGMLGIFLLIEAARQLWGECGERQVKGAQTALCTAIGPWASASNILRRES